MQASNSYDTPSIDHPHKLRGLVCRDTLKALHKVDTLRGIVVSFPFSTHPPNTKAALKRTFQGCLHFYIFILKKLEIKLYALCQRQLSSVIDGVRLPAHVSLPGV